MLAQALFVILLVAAVLEIGFVRESLRARSLRSWVAQQHGARSHWPFQPEEHPTVPATELAQLFTSRALPGWASALQVILPEGEALVPGRHFGLITINNHPARKSRPPIGVIRPSQERSVRA